ncbi:MAG TPA: LemA family protein [Thermodesulfobacteriota bacterium]|nr:LemA family protein [Thermodesulfobacteriota bacterium]
MVGLIVLGCIGVIIAWGIVTFNRLVSLRNEVQNSWKQIDVQLKRRHDLIPNLVSVVKGTMEFEQDTLEKVINARAKAVSAGSVQEKVTAENMLTQALGKLFAVMENYPQLRSNDNIMQLQEELTSTENRIGFARQLYNDLVAQYRIKQEVFPNNIFVAFFGGFKKEVYFEAEEEAKKAPQADISIRRDSSH